MASRLDLYLHKGGDYYVNTEQENQKVSDFASLYSQAKAYQESLPEANPSKIEQYRKAYSAELNALDITTGTESKRKSRQLRKLVYDMIESKVDNSIPLPKIVPRYKTDRFLIDTTENFIKSEVDTFLAKYLNDAAERATYIDGTTWFKVSWNSTNSSHHHNGDVEVELRTIDQIVPQPGIKNYKDMEYIFERVDVSITKIFDLYGRLMSSLSDDSNTVKVINCYYLNENHIVGLFSWCESSRQVICDEEDWQIRKVRVCTNCGEINPVEESCHLCGHTHFKYRNAETEVLAEDLLQADNPYIEQPSALEGQLGQSAQPGQPTVTTFATAGTTIPFYRIRQLPFVPRPAISSIHSIYGISEVKMILEEQDGVNKILTKAMDKALKSGTILTKPEKVKLGDKDDTIKVVSVRTSEEAAMIQARMAASDVSQDIVMANLLYEDGRNTSGVTNSFQGRTDNTATSGKARQYAIAQTAGRIESLRVMKAAAFAGLYELVFKYLLAFSDESRKFVKILPNGEQQELIWNKYMFLDRDNYGNIYYRDDFSFNTDPAATLSQDRATMWQETVQALTMGAFGNPSDPRTLELYWNILAMYDYPLAKLALAGIKDNSKHLPVQIEQALLNNPDLLQQVVQLIQAGSEQRGGARPNSGPEGNGATHRANVERTNERNRVRQAEEPVRSAQQGGG